MDLNIKLSNGQVLRGFITSAVEKPRAMIILVHGLGEHINRYSSLAELFSRNGISLAGVDLPGHGRSDGKRGHIRNYDSYNEMADILIRECSKTFPEIPVFLYGHSLGGGIVLNYLLTKCPDIRGAIVTSPWLRLTFHPEESKIKMAGFLKNIVPKLTLPNGLVPDHISRDKKVVADYINDPMVHRKISVSLIHEAFANGSEVLKNAQQLKIPVLLMHGSDDQICSPDGSREFASKTTMAELKIWDDGYHELHNELFKEEVFDYIINWINKKVQ